MRVRLWLNRILWSDYHSTLIESVWMFLPPPVVSQQQELKKEGEWKKKLNHLGIDVGKKKCRVALKDDRGKILDEYSSLITILGEY